MASMKMSALIAIPMKSQPMKIRYESPMNQAGRREVPGTSMSEE